MLSPLKEYATMPPNFESGGYCMKGSIYENKSGKGAKCMGIEFIPYIGKSITYTTPPCRMTAEVTDGWAPI